MHETYRMLAHEQELDLEREARKRSLASHAPNGMRHRRRRNVLTALILGFAAAAIIASSAQTSVSNYTPEALRALSLRAEAMNDQYQSMGYERALENRSAGMNKLYQTQALRPDDRSGIRGAEPTVVTPDLAEIQRHVRAGAIGSQATVSSPDDRAGLHGPGIVRSPEFVTAKGGGFDWADASIGGAAALGFVLLAAGAITFAVRGRRTVRSARVVVP